MKWIKHDTDANQDAKLQNVLLDYGLEGYGLYWYCMELIGGNVSADNITFELEHDARIIARNTGSTAQKVEEMMRYFVGLGLFESDEGKITCFSMAKRIDKSMTSNPQMRNIISKIKQVIESKGDYESSSHDGVMMGSCDSHDGVMMESETVMQDKIRSDKNKNIGTEKTANAPFSKVVDLYNDILKALPRVVEKTETRQRVFKARWRESEDRQDLNWWKSYFEYISNSNFLMGRTDNPFTCNFDWIINPTNMAKIIEGNYHREQ